MTIARCYWCLTDCCSYFHFFGLCKRVADGRCAVIHSSEEVSNLVLQVVSPHFAGRHPGMVFGGQEVQVLMVLIVQIACLYLVWMWRKSVVKKKRVSTACLGKFLYLRGIDIA